MSKVTAFCLMLFCCIGAIGATNFQYFESGIDYWDEENAQTTTETKKNEPATKPKVTFNWKKFLDPRNKEFFREGNHVPPEPFMELVRNPSDNNIKNWFALIKMKNSLITKMQERIQEYLKRHPEMNMDSQKVLRAQAASYRDVSPDTRRFRFRFYFDTNCPHCKRMYPTISRLQSLGFYVEAGQVDTSDSAIVGLNVSSTRASKKELKQHKVSSVPLLLIGDMKKKIVYRLQGYQTLQSILNILKQKTTSF